jgi:hypothetical protein
VDKGDGSHILQDIILQGSASELGFSNGDAGGYDDLAAKITIMTNS